MATKKNGAVNDEIVRLKKQVSELQQQNSELQQAVTKSKTVGRKKKSNWLRKTGVVFFISLSIVSFMLFNLSSWVKNTILDTDTFVATMQPLIAQPAVQQRIQDQVTDKLFENVDVETTLQSTLPENLQFLSGPLSSQIENFVGAKVGQVIASPQIYNLWGEALGRVQSRLVAYIQNDNADGVISVNDVYAAASDRVSQDSRVSFLLNKQLPDKVGTVTLAEVKWLPEARKYVDTISAAPIVFLITSLVSFALAVLLSVKKRRSILTMVILSIVMMLATLGALAIGNQQIANVAKPENVALAQAVYSTITEPLENRTLGYASLLGAIALITILTANIGWIRTSRRYIDDKSMTLANKVLPASSVPAWLQGISQHITAITWTVFIVLFVTIGVRIPPEYREVKTGLLWAALAALVIYIVHVIVRSLGRPANK